MFRKAKHTKSAVCELYDAKTHALWHERNTVKGLAQAIIYYSQPLKVVAKDTAEWHATNNQIQETQTKLHVAMTSYDAHREEFAEWISLHQTELPASYQQVTPLENALESVLDALSIINKCGFIYYERYIKKGVDK